MATDWIHFSGRGPVFSLSLFSLFYLNILFGFFEFLTYYLVRRQSVERFGSKERVRVIVRDRLWFQLYFGSSESEVISSVSLPLLVCIMNRSMLRHLRCNDRFAVLTGDHITFHSDTRYGPNGTSLVKKKKKKRPTPSQQQQRWRRRRRPTV